MQDNSEVGTHGGRDLTRRGFVRVAATGALGVGALGKASLVTGTPSSARQVGTLRWGVVGTGSIANLMADMIKQAENAELSAVSSRRMETAREYADQHGLAHAFDSWADMIASDVVDAVYVATPTSAREEICVAAAGGGKHVLGEKPFASLDSVRRIIATCQENDVAFMDGTHFSHHPRTFEIRARTEELVGSPGSLASAFQFNLTNRANIRYNPELEPMGAIGDAGWYTMRAAVEYLPPDVEVEGAAAFLRRDEETGAVSAGSGALRFADGVMLTWNCGFDSAAVVGDVRISGTSGVLYMDDFLFDNGDGSAGFMTRGPALGRQTITVPSEKRAAVLMFEDMAAAAADRALRDQWMARTERTQMLLDAIWEAGLESERSGR
ncbi:MAG: Gfo/Idh/MocA family oxidoreductase [Gemmatimonadales bacterium]|jgi:predicted dehydrogenase|nr:MAG: Gfo/Idh/MocA family oxidoreductase [Gemmatimonadales bacterium]